MSRRTQPSNEEDEISEAERQFIAKRFYYMQAENIAKDFPGKREREAIAAVFKWLSFHMVVARPLKRSGTYATHMPLRKMSDTLKESTHRVIDRADIDKAEKLLCPAQPTKKSRHSL